MGSVAAKELESPIQFPETRSVFNGVHNKTFSVVAVCVNNPDGSPVGINR